MTSLVQKKNYDINLRVLSASRVDWGFFLFPIFSNFTPPPPRSSYFNWSGHCSQYWNSKLTGLLAAWFLEFYLIELINLIIFLKIYILYIYFFFFFFFFLGRGVKNSHFLSKSALFTAQRPPCTAIHTSLNTQSMTPSVILENCQFCKAKNAVGGGGSKTKEISMKNIGKLVNVGSENTCKISIVFEDLNLFWNRSEAEMAPYSQNSPNRNNPPPPSLLVSRRTKIVLRFNKS